MCFVLKRCWTWLRAVRCLKLSQKIHKWCLEPTSASNQPLYTLWLSTGPSYILYKASIPKCGSTKAGLTWSILGSIPTQSAKQDEALQLEPNLIQYYDT